MRKTKIICTIGPASDSEETLGKLVEAGMNVARLNFSHGNHESHARTITRIRKVADEKNVPIAILQDLSGPKIRVGQIANEPILLEDGQRLTLTAEPGATGPDRVSIGYEKLPQDVEASDKLLLADGSITLQIESVSSLDINCIVLDGGELSSRKGITVPDRTLSVTAVTKKDQDDLAFGLAQGVDYVAMSFVRKWQDVEQIKKLIESEGYSVPVIAKIEKHEALQNIDEIINVADGIMVARGDLAVETPLEGVPIAQKTIIYKCNCQCKPVITATQMLKSMVDEPRPTRAEANDVANAVLDGTDAVMLSEETTIGKFPVEVVETMVRILTVTESSEAAAAQRVRHQFKKSIGIARAVSHAAFQMALDLDATAILTPTRSGSTARMISSFRPQRDLVALCPEAQVARQLNLIWGVHPLVGETFQNTEDMVQQSKDKALQAGLVQTGDTVVITAGVPKGETGTTNVIKAIVL